MDATRQIQREREGLDAGIRRYKLLVEAANMAGEGSSLGSARRLTRAWLGPTFAAIRLERAAVMRGSNGPGAALYGPALMLIDGDRISLITIAEMLNSVMKHPDGCPIGQIAYRIGSEIIAEAEADMIADAGMSIKAAIDRKLKKISASSIHAYAKNSMANSLFNRRVCVALGARCISIAMSVCMTDYRTNRQAFERVTIKKGRRTIGCIRMTASTAAMIDEAHKVRSLMVPRHSAMIVSPRSWAKGQGGYLSFDVPMLGRSTREQDEAIAECGMYAQRHALDVVSMQGWKINATVLAVAMELWKKSANIPGLGNPDGLVLLPKPEDERVLPEWKAEAAKAIQAERKHAAERSKFLRRLHAAESLVGNVFYMPHRLDWRGRMHPMPADLNHHQGDFSRSLLLFSHDGIETDTDWLKIHFANCWGNGLQREAFDARHEWATRHWNDMIRVGRDPIGQTWWHKAAEPWQFLACCVAANRPEVAACLPIQLDHTANALQHVVAIGLDQGAASLVNLTKSELPNDPYKLIVQKIHRKICEMAENGDEMATEALPYVVKSVLKRPLMTTVYRVSRHGAARQVADALPSSVNRQRRMKIARWISDIAIDVMHDTFRTGMNVIKWIEESARACLDTDPDAVLKWRGCSGMPIVQPYRRYKRNIVRTAMQSITVVDTDSDAPCDRKRQMRGVFANFIQSIEASQMHGVAMGCGEMKIPFAGVHDSYWTVSAHASELHATVRQHFAGLHLSDPLSKLAEEWSAAYPGASIKPLPPRGTFLLEESANAHYMLS